MLLAWCDNKGVVGIINKMCSRSPEMMAELRIVIALLARLDVDVRMRWVPTAFNPSDYYTRFASKAEWRLNCCKTACSSPFSLSRARARV